MLFDEKFDFGNQINQTRQYTQTTLRTMYKFTIRLLIASLGGVALVLCWVVDGGRGSWGPAIYFQG